VSVVAGRGAGARAKMRHPRCGFMFRFFPEYSTHLDDGGPNYFNNSYGTPLAVVFELSRSSSRGPERAPSKLGKTKERMAANVTEPHEEPADHHPPEQQSEDVVAKIQEALQTLDREFDHDLVPREQSLRRLLEQVRREEQFLQQAFDEARGGGAALSTRPQQQQQQAAEAAAQRLEQALFRGGASEDDTTLSGRSTLDRNNNSNKRIRQQSAVNHVQPMSQLTTRTDEEASVMSAVSKNSAVARLEQALLANDSSSDDDGDS